MKFDRNASHPVLDVFEIGLPRKVVSASPGSRPWQLYHHMVVIHTIHLLNEYNATTITTVFWYEYYTFQQLLLHSITKVQYLSQLPLIHYSTVLPQLHTHTTMQNPQLNMILWCLQMKDGEFINVSECDVDGPGVRGRPSSQVREQGGIHMQFKMCIQASFRVFDTLSFRDSDTTAKMKGVPHSSKLWYSLDTKFGLCVYIEKRSK